MSDLDGLDLQDPLPEAHVTTSDRFAMVPERVLFNLDLSDGAVRCYAVLARLANGKGLLWHGQASLAEKMGKSERIVRGYMTELQKAGELVRAKRRMNQTNVWRLRTFTPLDRLNPAGPDRLNPAAPRTGGKLPTNENQESQRATTAPPVDKPAKAPRAKSARDLLWDALCEVLGWNPEKMTKGERGRLGRTVTGLLEAGARPGDVHARAARYREHWPNVDLTPEALEKHWSTFAPPKVDPAKSASRDPGMAW